MKEKKRFVMLNSNLTLLTKRQAVAQAKKIATQNATNYYGGRGFYVLEIKTFVSAEPPPKVKPKVTVKEV